MKSLFSFTIFLQVINVIISLKNEYISNFFNHNPRMMFYLSSNTKNVTECFLTYSDFRDFEKFDFINLALCELENCKNDIQKVEEVFHILTFLDALPLVLFKGNLKIILSVIQNSFRNGLMNDIQYLIMNNSYIIDNMMTLLYEFKKGKDLNYTIFLENLHQIIMLNGTEIIIDKFFNASSENFFEFLDIVFNPFNELKELIGLFKKELNVTNVKSLLNLCFNVIRIYNNGTEIIDVVADFFKANINITNKLIEIMKNDLMKYVYSKLIIFPDNFMTSIKDWLLEINETLDILGDIIQNITLIEQVADLLKNLDSDEYIIEHLPSILLGLEEKNIENGHRLSDLMIYLIYKINDNKKLKSYTLSLLQHEIGELFLEKNIISYNISQDCMDLFNYTFFNDKIDNKDFFIQYLNKFIFDSANEKGNFLTFDNCVEEYNISIKPNNSYIIYPAFVIGIIDEFEELEKFKNTSFYYKYNFLSGYCFPYGYKNKEDKDNNNPMCSKSDYDKIVTFLYNFFNNETIKTVNTISLHEENRYPTSQENLYGIIGLLILAIPLIIYVVLIIIKKLIIKKQKRKSVNEETIDDYKCYHYLNEIFNIFKNGRELFNCSLDSINYNNVNGMIYIKGLIGISIIFTIFGQTFIALANLPTREFGIWGFYKIMINYLYLFFYIGYRYSPRVLFSCSGYSLIYKYLCYIEQEQGLYFLKFFFLQSYKYILLFSIIIFFRYSIYYINIFIRQTKRPIWEVYQYFIEKESENFFLKFYTFLFHLGENMNEMKQKLILYLYIPINEIVFFILGTIIISIGYKFKLRIDIFILISIIIIYLSKIIIFFTYFFQKGFLSTTDFYSIDYGLFMPNPLCNIGYFLIGMYFGLINYSIQKGITNLYKDKNYNDRLWRLSKSEMLTEGEENEDDNKDINNTENKEKKREETEPMLDKYTINNDNGKDENLPKDNNIDKTKSAENGQNNTNNKNELNNKNSKNFVDEENITNEFKKGEYTEKIKQMPFLITPIKFVNFHRSYKDKCFLILLTILAFIVLIVFIMVSKIVIYIKLNIDKNIPDKDIVSKLSFESIFSDLALNIFYSLDIEIVVFFVQWGTFLLYFRQVEIIRSFLNHNYWSFFVKSYFTFTIISPVVILTFFYQNENATKLSIYNMILYSFIILILLFVIIIFAYSCYELPLKKTFKFILKGKEILNNEEYDENDEEEEEEEDNGDDYENIILKNDK